MSIAQKWQEHIDMINRMNENVKRRNLLNGPDNQEPLHEVPIICNW